MKRLLLIFAVICVLSIAATAQTTAFNFQGRLNDGSSPANGKYDLQFKLFDSLTGGTQISTTLERPNTTLINGVFSTQLDFGVTAFNGGDRFIEISLRATAIGNSTPNAYVILGARQQILSVPYTIRSLRTTLADEATHAVNADNATNAVNATTANNAANLNNLPASRYVQQDANGNVSISRDLTVLSGNVRIGFPLTNPSKLEIDSNDALLIKGYKPFLSVQDITVGDNNIGNHRIKSENGGLSFTVNQNPTVTTDKSPSLVITRNGNLSQPKGFGLPKIILEFDVTNNIILRCYDAINNHYYDISGNSSDPDPAYLQRCGFTATRFPNGPNYNIVIDFGFDVSNQIVVGTNNTQSSAPLNFIKPNPNGMNTSITVTPVSLTGGFSLVLF